MGYSTYHVIICDECKVRSDIISFRKQVRIEEINIFNIIGFIEKHSVCHWGKEGGLIIKNIGNDIYGLRYPTPLKSNYEPYRDGPFYVEDLDVGLDIAIDDKTNIEEIFDYLTEHRERYKKVQVLKDKLGICLDKEDNYSDQIKLYKEALNSKEIRMNYLPMIDLGDCEDCESEVAVRKCDYTNKELTS